MFNLIVSGGLENEHRGTISAGRVFEHTEDFLIARFKPNSRLDIPGVMSLPTILMEEGTSDEIATFGWLSRIELRGTEFHLQYVRDPEIPRPTNADVYAMVRDLRSDD